MGRKTFLDNQIPVLSVSELTRQLQSYMETAYGDLQVEGEVSGFKVSHSGHAYFNLKDEGAVLSCVIWRTTLDRLKAKFEDGQMIRVQGGLTIYPPRGAYQLVVRRVELAGEGLLQKRFEALKKKLEAEGLFASERKRPIPVLPQRIGVITSPSGAAIRDFLKVLSRFPGPEIDLFPVRVQGLEAAGEIAHALEVLGSLNQHDVLVLTRGGGSIEDLWCFNEEIVARALAACPIPVISAVGHEVDFTISDFVADLRAATPTAAALHIVRSREDWFQKLDIARRALVQQGIYRLNEWNQAWERIRDVLHRVSPLSRIGTVRQRLDELIGRMELRTEGYFERSRLKLEQMKRELQGQGPRIVRQYRDRVGALSGRLDALSPASTFRRGYSLTATLTTGQILKNSRETRSGNRLRTRLYQGEVISQVIEVNHGSE